MIIRQKNRRTKGPVAENLCNLCSYVKEKTYELLFLCLKQKLMNFCSYV